MNVGAAALLAGASSVIVLLRRLLVPAAPRDLTLARTRSVWFWRTSA